VPASPARAVAGAVAGRLAGSDGGVEQQRGWVTVWVGSKVVHYAVYDDIDEGGAAAERLAQERG
jgi:hypothetical protein